MSTIDISGTVYLDSTSTEAAHIVIKIDSLTLSGISSTEGKFEFENIMIPDTANIINVAVSYFGYSSFQQNIPIAKKKKFKIPVYLKRKNEQLDEVLIEGTSTYKKTVNKLVYSIRAQDFIKNTKGTAVLNSVPNLSYSRVEGVKIEGTREAKIFIDGIEGNITDLEVLDVSEIDKIEVTYNPSARFGSEFSGGIINIRLKERNRAFYKAGVEMKKGLLLNSTFFIPQFSLKTHDLMIKSYFNYISSHQEVNFDLYREIPSALDYKQESYREPHVIQKSGNFQIRYALSEKDILYLNSNYNLNKVAGAFKGSYTYEDQETQDFTNNTGNSYEQFVVNVIYEKNFDKNTFYFKSKYLDYNKENYFQIMEDNTPTTGDDIGSGIRESTGEILFEMPKEKIFERQFNLVWNTKYIGRNYRFENNEFYLNQYIGSLGLDIEHQLSNRISFMISPYLEIASNQLPHNKTSQVNFLPTGSLNLKTGKKNSLEFSYARRIHRPNSYDLNEEAVYLNPGVVNSGNRNLEPEVRSNYSLRLFQSLENRSFLTLKASYSSTKDAILEDINEENGLLIYTKNNIGAAEESGFSLGYGGALFKVFRANINAGLNYYHFANPEYVNSGFSFNSSLFLSGNFYKGKLNVSFYSSYRNPTYSFVSKTTRNPYTELSLSTNFLKDKLSCSLVYSDMFNWGASKTIELQKINISQTTRLHSRISNVSIILSYRFGRSFNDRYENKSIENTDINYTE